MARLPKKLDKLEDHWSEAFAEASTAYENEDVAEAMTHAERCLGIAREFRAAGGIRPLEAYTLGLMSGVHRKVGDDAQALELAKRAYAIMAEAGDDEDRYRYRAAENVASIHGIAGRFDEAEPWYRRAASHAGALEETEDQRFESDALHLLFRWSVARLRGGDPDGALEVFALARRYARRDYSGDGLCELAAMATQGPFSGRIDDQEQFLREILDELRGTLSTDLAPRMESPFWVLNYEVARVVVRGIAYQKRGVEPLPMLKVRHLIAVALAERGEGDAALEEYRAVAERIEALRADVAMEDADAPLELLLADDETEDGDELSDADLTLESETHAGKGPRELLATDDNTNFVFANILAMYAALAMELGRDRGDRSLVDLGRTKAERALAALDAIPPGGDPEAHEEELRLRKQTEELLNA